MIDVQIENYTMLSEMKLSSSNSPGCGGTIYFHKFSVVSLDAITFPAPSSLMMVLLILSMFSLSFIELKGNDITTILFYFQIKIYHNIRL